MNIICWLFIYISFFFFFSETGTLGIWCERCRKHKTIFIRMAFVFVSVCYWIAFMSIFFSLSDFFLYLFNLIWGFSFLVVLDFLIIYNCFFFLYYLFVYQLHSCWFVRSSSSKNQWKTTYFCWTWWFGNINGQHKLEWLGKNNVSHSTSFFRWKWKKSYILFIFLLFFFFSLFPNFCFSVNSYLGQSQITLFFFLVTNLTLTLVKVNGFMIILILIGFLSFIPDPQLLQQ